MVKAAADKYAAEKKLTRRTPADCQSKAHPRRASRDPLKGAALAARRSRLRGAPGPGHLAPAPRKA